ncbi:MAG: HAMP domain-containing histidine kinase, partial [Rubrivivax sp.]
NALRYGEGKPVQVDVDLTDDGMARLAVTDQGVGIPREHQHKVFQQFERLPNASKAPGMGLGLFISQQFVQAHGGRITLCSEPGAGSCFEVLLPLAPPLTT